ncbi:MAG: TolC family protein [Bacteriovoracaceae bacterium]
MMYLFIFLSMTSLSLASISLPEAYKAAEKNLESLKRAESQVEQANYRRKQAIGALTPTISGFGSYTEIDPLPAGGATAAFTRINQYSYGLRLQQPLLRGGSLSAYSQRKEEGLLSVLSKDASQIQVYQLTINAFYNLYLGRKDLKNVHELLKFSQTRVSELKERTKLGRSRQGELVQAEAQLYNVEADAEAAEAALKTAELQFEFITGLKSEELIVENDLPSLESINTYMSKVSSRPDVKAQNQRVVVADSQVSVAKGGHAPNLDFTSNYYFLRTGVLADSNWDVGLQLTVPIWQGKVIDNEVKVAVEAKKQEQLTSNELERSAKRDIQTLYQQYQRNLEQVNRLEVAVKKSKQSYDLNQKDYKYGQATNLEVLEALNVYISSKRNYDRAVVMAYMSYKNLEASSGVLP